MTIKEIQERLLALRDEKYKDFHSKLIPTIAPETIIGVRMPQQRKLAKDLVKEAGFSGLEDFLNTLPHTYYDENILHGCIISLCRDYAEAVRMVSVFLPYIDNWAVCDLLCPKVFGKHLDELLPVIDKWIHSTHPYTIRFGLGMLMRFYLDEAFEERFLQMAAEVKSDEYYVNMMVAWYFATALAKQYDATIPYLEQHRLEVWVHNKTIQKAVESYRISAGEKEYLRRLRVKALLT